jgi:hypothetical protein
MISVQDGGGEPCNAVGDGLDYERGHALQPVPIARVHMRLIALCVAGAAVYDATVCALTVR